MRRDSPAVMYAHRMTVRMMMARMVVRMTHQLSCQRSGRSRQRWPGTRGSARCSAPLATWTGTSMVDL